VYPLLTKILDPPLRLKTNHPPPSCRLSSNELIAAITDLDIKEFLEVFSTKKSVAVSISFKNCREHEERSY